jgi:predicted DNA-binding ribbon-helix-helix protein
MCEYYAGADPILYESRTRSIRIDGVLTSLRLENLVWDTLAKMAEAEGSSTNTLIAQLYREVLSRRGECPNFASFLRVTSLRYLNLMAEQGTGKSNPKSYSSVEIAGHNTSSERASTGYGSQKLTSVG